MHALPLGAALHRRSRQQRDQDQAAAVLWAGGRADAAGRAARRAAGGAAAPAAGAAGAGPRGARRARLGAQRPPEAPAGRRRAGNSTACAPTQRPTRDAAPWRGDTQLQRQCPCALPSGLVRGGARCWLVERQAEHIPAAAAAIDDGICGWPGTGYWHRGSRRFALPWRPMGEQRLEAATGSGRGVFRPVCLVKAQECVS
mmetsp:Transcript_42577/g.107633  ORF Transcript_42577/g.107633 Transcript_42577/m.107633 type:complete len:200 (-) Transcript_42577:795-1394(-)